MKDVPSKRAWSLHVTPYEARSSDVLDFCFVFFKILFFSTKRSMAREGGELRITHQVSAKFTVAEKNGKFANNDRVGCGAQGFGKGGASERARRWVFSS